MLNTEVINNFLGSKEYLRLCEIVEKPRWGAKTLYPTNQYSRIWQWDYTEDKQEICDTLLSRYSIRSGEEYEVTHMYVNGQTTALDSNPHTDRSYKTLIYFPMREWEDSWGGHLMVWEGERDKSKVEYFPPRPNSLIVLTNTNDHYPWHFATAPNILSDRRLRISLGLHVELKNESH